MKHIKQTILLSTILPLTACAKSTSEIPAQYVSPLQYKSHSCTQVEQEMVMLSRRVSDLGAQVDKTASDDNAQMAIGMILFWPALFALDGDTPQAAEYGRLKGEFEALEKAAIQKNCNITIERPVIKKPEPNSTKTSTSPYKNRR